MPGLNSSLLEVTTGVTDAFLGVLALICLAYLQRFRQSNPWKVGVWTAVLASLAGAALLGAVVHGLELGEELKTILWRPLYFLLSLVVALFAVGASYDWLGKRLARYVLFAMLPVAAGFFAVTQLFSDSFLVFVFYEGASMLLSLAIYLYLAVSGRLRGAWIMTLAILLNLLAAGIQANNTVHVTLVWPLDHNGVFHLVQIVALVVLVMGLRRTLVR